MKYAYFVGIQVSSRYMTDEVRMMRGEIDEGFITVCDRFSRCRNRGVNYSCQGESREKPHNPQVFGEEAKT